MAVLRWKASASLPSRHPNCHALVSGPWQSLWNRWQLHNVQYSWPARQVPCWHRNWLAPWPQVQQLFQGWLVVAVKAKLSLLTVLVFQLISLFSFGTPEGHLPPHDHKVAINIDSSIVRGNVQFPYTGNTHHFGPSGHGIGNTSSVGHGLPFSIMPPYVALNYFIKE